MRKFQSVLSVIYNWHGGNATAFPHYNVPAMNLNLLAKLPLAAARAPCQFNTLSPLTAAKDTPEPRRRGSVFKFGKVG